MQLGRYQLPDNELRAHFREFVLDDNHPCVMAQTIFRDDEANIKQYSALKCPISAQRLLDDLGEYVANYNPSDPGFQTFMAVFAHEVVLDELAYEEGLWCLLQTLHNLDTAPWDPEVSNDPSSENFSLSLHGRAFYVVGLHPGSSRRARRAPYATVVFNLHDQFERLRSMGAYHRVRDRIRKRDKRLQGTVNPMLSDFGSRSEARQYSGRAVDEQWKCPFLASAKHVSPSPE